MLLTFAAATCQSFGREVEFKEGWEEEKKLESKKDILYALKVAKSSIKVSHKSFKRDKGKLGK